MRRRGSSRWADAGTTASPPWAAAWLGPEPLDSPALALAAIGEAVVQPVVAVLPELPRVGHEPEPAPPLRPCRLALVAQLRHPAFEPFPRLDRPALRRGERRQPSAERARAKVGIRLGLLHPRDGAFDPHLPAERLPVEEQGRPRVLRQLAALAARVVREEDDPGLVRLLHQHHAHRWASVRGCRRERHLLRRGNGRLRIREPAAELHQRVGVERHASQGGHLRDATGNSRRGAPPRAATPETWPRWTRSPPTSSCATAPPCGCARPARTTRRRCCTSSRASPIAAATSASTASRLSSRSSSRRSSTRTGRSGAHWPAGSTAAWSRSPTSSGFATRGGRRRRSRSPTTSRAGGSAHAFSSSSPPARPTRASSASSPR